MKGVLSQSARRRSGSGKHASKRVRAFSLIEILVVIAIISVLAALIFPVFATGKENGNRAVTLSNLRQCGQALATYAPEADLPVAYPFAIVALEKAPIWDPSDRRPHQKQPWSLPFIGSYGYIRGVAPFDVEAEMRDYANEQFRTRVYKGSVYPVMASTWQGRPLVTEFEPVDAAGAETAVFQRCMADRTCRFPDRITYLMSDGSSRSVVFDTIRSGRFRPHFSWHFAFGPSNL